MERAAALGSSRPPLRAHPLRRPGPRGVRSRRAASVEWAYVPLKLGAQDERRVRCAPAGWSRPPSGPARRTGLQCTAWPLWPDIAGRPPPAGGIGYPLLHKRYGVGMDYDGTGGIRTSSGAASVRLATSRGFLTRT